MKKCILNSVLIPVSLLFAAASLIFISDAVMAQGAKIVYSDDGFAPLFPFIIVKTAPDNITNVHTWKEILPAGTDGFLRIEDGRFVSDKGVVRFVGTNLCFSAAFPPSKAEAENLAKNLARFGINAVRLHHMDNSEIWGGKKCKNHLDINPEQLDKLDYLIYQLEQNGIYVNINLHVSRQFDQRDGFISSPDTPKYDKGLDNFQPKMIQLQKKYAKDLLTHVNPYTKKAYVDDPGVAMIEINNENSVICSFGCGHLDNLPQPYADEFRLLWNDFLGRKYSSTEALRLAWGCKFYPQGEEMIPDGAFPFPAFPKRNGQGWELQTDAFCDAPVNVFACSNTEIGGRNAIHLQVNKKGKDNWIPQLHRNGLRVEQGVPYTIQFKCRTQKPGEMSIALIENHNPWGRLGFDVSFKTSDKWQTYQFSFIPDKTDSAARITFNGFQAGQWYEIADVSLKSGGNIGFGLESTLESKTIPVPKKSGVQFPSTAARQDFADFLYEIENRYWQDMYAYVKSLGAKQPVSGTQLQYGYWNVQASLDYCDIHAYWNHPVFPGRPWDGNNWYVRNRALVNYPADNKSTLNRLACVRVFNRPLTVSEYDHPYPNPYCGEGNVMAFAMASFQDWSGVFQFSWKHGSDYANPICNNFFDMASNVGKTAHLPACYAMFVQNGVKSGDYSFVQAPEMSVENEKTIMADNLVGYHRNLDALGLNYSLPWAIRTGVRLPDVVKSNAKTEQIGKTVTSWQELPERFGGMEKKWIRSSTGELYCDFQKVGKGYFTVSAPKVKVFTGFPDGRLFDLGVLENQGAVTLKPGKTRLDWLTFSMTQAKPGRYLIAATGLIINTDMDLVDLDGEKWTCGNRWGVAPVLCEGIEAELRIELKSPGKARLFALNENGDRAQEIPVVQKDNTAIIQLNPQYRAIWYELELDCL